MAKFLRIFGSLVGIYICSIYSVYGSESVTSAKTHNGEILDSINELYKSVKNAPMIYLDTTGKLSPVEQRVAVNRKITSVQLEYRSFGDKIFRKIKESLEARSISQTEADYYIEALNTALSQEKEVMYETGGKYIEVRAFFVPLPRTDKVKFSVLKQKYSLSSREDMESMQN